MPTETVKIIVDGKEIEAPKGENLLKVLIEHKIPVPYYCYHPGLSIAGACRMCTVEVSNAPRPMIACNTQVTEGLIVKTTTEKVKEIQRWNLSFHLINHPLDCPICDQAGECGLQDFYMKYGRYNSEMHEPKVLKRKVISIGKEVMLDTERCILCSRCVRFFDEVTKTSEMAIFNRGDRSEIGTYEDRELNNNYTLNSVDICPVGALTSKDFRFKKRVWFLKDIDSICPGCSTGCNVKVSADLTEKRTYRMLPRYNEAVNGYWMCDYGRMRYKQTNSENRIHSPMKKRGHELIPIEWTEARETLLEYLKASPQEIAALITPQYTTEELENIYGFFTKKIGTNLIYHTVDRQEAIHGELIDGLLLRSDKNPNSNGLLNVSQIHHLDKNDFDSFFNTLSQNRLRILFVFAPEDPEPYADFLTRLNKAGEIPIKILIGTQSAHATPFFDLVLPTLAFPEKNGTFVNFKGLEQKIHAGVRLVDEAKPISEILCF
jgi:NADH-quinone oxidoreductase subunit G